MKSTLVLFLSFLFLNSYSQEMVLTTEDEIVYKNVEKKPEFLGYIDSVSGESFTFGQQGLLSFLLHKIQSNVLDSEKDFGSKIVVSFIVKNDGYIKDILVLKGIQQEFDEQVVRVLKIMEIKKLWKPGNKNGKSVNTLYTLPITIHFK